MKKEKPDKKAKATKGPAKTLDPQGFLLPKEYKMRIQWQVNPIFRATFLILLLTLLYGLTLIPRWIFAEEWRKASADIHKTSLEESEWITASLNKIRPIRTKYREIEQILRYRRIPLSPVLSSIQRNIPKEVSINKITWEANLQKTSNNILISGRKAEPLDKPVFSARQAMLTLEIYATPEWNKERSPAAWLANVEKDIADLGIHIRERKIGTPKPYIPIGEIAKKMPEGGGTSIEVLLRLELAGPQEKETQPTRAVTPKAPTAPPQRLNRPLQPPAR